MDTAIPSANQTPGQTFSPFRERVARHPIAGYYLITLAISWMIGAMLIAKSQGWIEAPVPFGLHYLYSFGPMLAGVFMTWVVSGRAGLGELWKRITQWRIGLNWQLVAWVSPAALFMLALPFARLISGELPDLRLLGQANYLPYLGLWVLPLWLVTFGFGEEIGWRGFLLPRLQKTRTASRSTFLVGCMWLLWHLPAFFYLTTYDRLGLIMLPGFAFSVLCGAVIFTWLYNSTRGSVYAVAVWHAVFDLFTASAVGQGVIGIVMSAGVVIWALVIANRLGPMNFSREERHSL
jgi:membrane protease YdiL (CAAX protease family)